MFDFFKERPALSLTPDQEKQQAAGSSVLAACGLVGMKLVVGLTTGSLGILAEAAHSGLDLVAAVMTFFAVRFSSAPADRDHPYGHGKFENISALFETLLLLVTCFWIVYTAITHLVQGDISVTVNIWSFLVIGVSIVVDVSRSRMLFRVALKHNSQALEADALHFSTDIWSSSVVLFGLICVSISNWFPQLEFLRYADAIAAIVVGIIVVQVSLKLGKRTIQVLLDVAPDGMEKSVIQAAEAVDGVRNCHHVRIRASGAQVFIDMHVLVDGNQTLKAAHLLTERIEQVVQGVVPGADVTVHPEPD